MSKSLQRTKNPTCFSGGSVKTRVQSAFGFLAGLVTTGTIASQTVFAASVLAPAKIQQTAQPITVQLQGSDRTGTRYGSGVLIAKQGNTYAVLTNRHVVCALTAGGRCDRTIRFQIRTSDNTLHPVTNFYTFEQPNGIPDVAIVLFQTPINYPIATFGDSAQLAAFDAVWINGYPGRNDVSPGKEPSAFHRGFFVTQMPDVHSEGYSLSFGMIAAPGMSGSPIFDASGRVIAIFGQSGSAGVLAGIPTTTILQLVKRSPLNRLSFQLDRSALVGTRPQFRAPQTAEDYYLRGVMQLKDSPQVALKDFDQAIALDPKLMLAYRGRAELRAQRGDRAGALRDFESVLKLDPDRTDALDARARLRLQWNDVAGAIADLTEAIQLEPQAATLLFNRATTYSRAGKFANAIADFNRGIALQPKDAVAYRERGRSYLQLNEFATALRDLNRSIELDPKSAIAWDLRGFIKLSMEDYRGAVADCTVAIELDPTSAIAYSDRGFAWLGLNNLQQALNDTAQAIRLNPKLGASYTIRAIALERTGNFSGAIAAYETVLGLLKENGQTNSSAYQGITATIAQLRGKVKSK